MRQGSVGTEVAWRRSRPACLTVIGVMGMIALVAPGCSGGSPASPTGTGGGGATGTGGTSVDGGGTGGAGVDAAADAATDTGRPPGPFWCTDYAESAAQTGWVQLAVTVPSRGSGPMTSPIQSCEVGATSWSVSASGTEADGIDETTMTFAISGTYQGPGRYTGTLAQGLSGSFSHDDLGTTPFTTVASTDCDICVNADGRSGSVSCWDLERSSGSATQFAFVTAGNFKCPGAQAKPADAPTDQPSGSGVGGLPSGDVLCHYLSKLDCPGRPADADCARHSDAIGLGNTCPDEWINWLTCAEQQPPSDYRCGMGDDLVMASGACATELSTLRTCRANAAVPTSPECDAFCAKVQSQCQLPCQRNVDCTTYDPHCAASKLAYLKCGVQNDKVVCGTTTGFILGCTYDDSVCP